MFHKRKDKGCESRILADDGQILLIEARWLIGKPERQQQRNIVNVSREYFIGKYGDVFNG
jgi:hypothetical protein